MIIIVGGNDINLRLDYINCIAESRKVIFFGLDKNPTLLNDDRYVYSFNFIALFFKLFIFCFKPNVSCIHSFDTIPNLLIIILSFFFNKIKFVKTHTGLGSVFVVRNKLKLRRRILLFFYKINTNNITSVLQNERDFRLFRLIGVKNPILIRSSGINVNKTFLAINFPIDSSKINVFLASRLIEEKGPLDYIKLVDLFNQRYESNNVDFYLIGSIENKNLKKKILSFSTKNFIYLKKVENLSSYLTSFDVCVFLSTYSEGVPRILLESMNSSLPIIAYKNVGTNDCVIDSRNGYLVNPGEIDLLVNKLNILVDNKETRVRFGKNSSIFVKDKFDLNSVFEEYLKIYEKN
jgi:glycosyltransferase involved in cell wall biosynthesis